MILLIAFTAILLIVSTYAWFTTQKDVSISNLKGTVEVAESLEISLDAVNWTQEINLDETHIQEDAYSGNNNLIPTELLPVSSTGETGSTVLPMYKGTANDTKLTEIAACDEADDSLTSTAVKYPSYFAFDLFVRNATKDTATGTMDTLKLNSNSSVWVLDGSYTNPLTNKSYTGNAEAGLQNTARVGFALYGTTIGATSSSSDILSTLNATSNTISKVSIWEPNAAAHVDYIVQNNNLVTGYAAAANFTATSQFNTFGLKAAAVTSGSIDDVYKWDNTTDLAEVKTVQTTTETATSPYIKEGVTTLKTAEATPAEFQIEANKVSKMRVYVWIEGQDVDCINWASYGGGLEVNIGLVKGLTDGDTTARGEVLGGS